ncbi:MAG: hypothetical protein J6T29_00605 [Alphaproteobacteria bacterium]|nr:hypothetical protein [Alphaproteobacteria bacterium]
MKKIICSATVLGLLVLSLGVRGDNEDFDETRTIAASDEYFNDTRDGDAKTIAASDEHSNGIRDDDAGTIVDVSFNESDDSVDGRMKRQENLLRENKSGKNYNELKVLQNSGFVVTKESLVDLERNFNNAVTKIDLFEMVNSDAALIQAFNFTMDEKAETNFIIGKYELPKYIKDNKELSGAMQNFVINLKKSKSMKEEEKQILDLEDLKNIYSLLEKDKNIGEQDVFSKFVKGMINVYKVLIARRLADEIMARDRGVVENKFTTSREYGSANVGAVAKNGVASVGASVSYHTDKGSDVSSFYTINVGKGARLSIGFGDARAIGAEVGASVDETKSAIFYSLEQLLDSGKVSTNILSAKELRQTLESRQKMQNRERELLSIFGKDVEGYLKTIGKIPVSTYLEWPKLTKASPSEEATNVSKQLDASVSILKAAGLNVIVSDDVKTWKRPSGYMTLVSEDCYPSDGLSAADIVEFLGKQYDISDTFGGKSDVNVLPIILGDIRAYNSVLNILAENKSDKKAEQRKHEIEKRWLPKHKFTSEGRLGVLKSMIATVSVLRKSAITDREKELFKQLHSEMSRLAKLLEFSKNKSSRSATFMTEAKAHNKAIQASASINIPYFGDAQISFTRSVSRDNPFQEENGDCMNFDFIVPLTPTGIVGAEAIDKSLNAYHQITTGINHTAFGYGDTFNLAKKGFNLIKGIVKAPGNLLKGTAAGISGYAVLSIAMIRVDAPKSGSVAYPARILSKSESKSEVTAASRSLPNRKFIKREKDKWAVWYYRGTAYLGSKMVAEQYSEYAQTGADYLKSGVNINDYLDMIKLSYSSSVGKEKIIIGTDTLSYLTAKYNAFSIGLQDSKNAMSPWYALKNNQKEHLIKLLENITDEESNVIYELQNMYNSIMDNIGENDAKTSEKCTKLFEDFLSACDDLVMAKDEIAKEKAFEKASALMDQIFHMNFDYNFMSDYRKAYQIKK